MSPRQSSNSPSHTPTSWHDDFLAMMWRMGNYTRRDILGSMAAAGATWALPLSCNQDRTTTYVDGLSLGPLTDIALRDSGLSAVLIDVSAGVISRKGGKMRFVRSFDATLRKITETRRHLRDLKAAFLATRGLEINLAKRQKRCAVFLQAQGCEILDGELWRLGPLYELGLRVLQLTHHHDNPFGGGALMKETRGLTELGHDCVERMNSLGVIPDLSHASDETAQDVLAKSSRPVVISHGAARALVDNPRCAPDEVLKGVGESGGVVGIFMMSCWLTTASKPTVEHLCAQFRHVANVAGIDAVGIANDYQVEGNRSVQKLGNDNAKAGKLLHPWWKRIHDSGVPGYARMPEHMVIPELNDARRMFSIHKGLEKAGFGASQIDKIMGGNWIRVLQSTLA